MKTHSTIVAAALLAFAAPAAADQTVIDRFSQLTRSSTWELTETVPLNFVTHHPQGLVRIGDKLYLSSVEITQPTERYPELREGLDRSAGIGKGHLFELDLQGNLLRDLTLGEGDVYHPGGIDYDGRFIWVPVAEYRPNSHAIVYRVDPASFTVTEVFRFPDHIGGVVHADDVNTLNGVSWGSRRLYRWSLDDGLNVTDAGAPPEDLRIPNPSHYIDYQDCHYLGSSRALCAGLVSYRMTADGPSFPLGGIELVDLEAGVPVHQVPVALFTDTGRVMTQNPFWVEATETGLRAYFIPEDDQSRLFIYDITP